MPPWGAGTGETKGAGKPASEPGLGRTRPMPVAALRPQSNPRRYYFGMPSVLLGTTGALVAADYPRFAVCKRRPPAACCGAMLNCDTVRFPAPQAARGRLHGMFNRNTGCGKNVRRPQAVRRPRAQMAPRNWRAKMRPAMRARFLRYLRPQRSHSLLAKTFAGIAFQSCQARTAGCSRCAERSLRRRRQP